MADTYLTLSTTAAGRGLIVRSLYGDSITFTRIVIGNGTPEDAESIDAMVNPLLSVSLTAAEPDSDYILLTGQTTSAQINAGFYGTEVGVYAEDGDGREYLFAYRYSAADADYYPSSDSGRTLELTISVVVQLGNAENVTAYLVEGDTYAAKADFDAHVADQTNPHGVTAEQIGLGNIPNVSTNNQTPTYTAAAALTALASGEKLSVAFGKLAKAVSSLISHLSSTSNPHGVTYTQAGAAAASHKHSTADITSGTLGVARGGTGGTTAAAARTNLGVLGMKSGTATPTTSTCPSGYVYFQYTN